MTSDPRRLSLELRRGEGGDLRRRRWIVGLSFLGAAMGQVVGLYQMGVLRRLPDLPTRWTDASRVDASDYAYRSYRMPDGLMMVATYAVTAMLAGAGGRDRARDLPLVPIALGAKTLYDAVLCLRLAREEWRENHAFCSYCQTATVASLASVALAMPEALRAAEELVERGRR
jgi:uncharacterized membrane protein